MKPCYYVITNLKGGVDKSIPVFELLTSEDFRWLLSEYSEYTPESLTLTDEDKEKLSDFLKNHLHHKTVESLLGVTNVINLTEVIDKANKKIMEDFSEADFWKAIKNYLSKNKNSVKELTNVLTISSNKIEEKILKIFNSEVETLADVDLNSQIREITDTIQELDAISDPTSYYRDLRSFLNLANNTLGWKDSKALVKVTGGIKQGSWNLDHKLVFLDSSDKNNLFTGLLKRLSSELSNEDFIEIFSEWNKKIKEWNQLSKHDKYDKYLVDLDNPNIKEFFNGTVTKDAIIPPKVNDFLELKNNNKLVKVKEAIDIVIDKWFDKIARKLGPDVSEETVKKYYNLIKNLFSSEKFIEEKTLMKTTEEVSDRLMKESLNTLYKLGRYDNNNKNRLGESYRQSTILKSDDLKDIPNLYEFFMKKFTLNKDIILMPKIGQTNTHRYYWVISAVYPRGDKVLVYGKRLNDTGKLIEGTSFLFDKDSEITYRKYDDFSDQEDKPNAELSKI